ncbi:hypothetical protein [Phaeobacter sp. B1627]|uniref:hypothetical protein n=1 Tax=Phaeobacter sp. B1627 TaxID=2583809 RepID=UPI00111B14CB|nr:hypothetical protein [Phaeobacter sp. B1627]TNJ44067.1 hypothetical protein FGE21_08895 [Phaeobacter sp. B1627]
MIGVVVWSDAARKKAVIWCEDQRDLAYSLLPEGAVGQLLMSKGDLVEFETRYEGALRIAENVRVVENSRRSGLADALRGSGESARRDTRAGRDAPGRDMALREPNLGRLRAPKPLSNSGSHTGTDCGEATEQAKDARRYDNSSRENSFQGAQITTLSIPDRPLHDRSAAGAGTGTAQERNGAPSVERTSAKILPFPELLRA